MTNTNTPRPGDFGVQLLRKRNWFRRSRFVASLISWGTHSPAYHAFLVVDHPTLGLRIVEAGPGGARLSNVNKHKNVAWSSLSLTDEQRKAVSDAGLKFVGRKYSFYDDAALGVNRAFKFKIPDFLWRWLSNGHSVECAQLVDAAELAGGVTLFRDGRQTGQVAPSDLYNIILGGSVIPLT